MFAIGWQIATVTSMHERACGWPGCPAQSIDPTRAVRRSSCSCSPSRRLMHGSLDSAASRFVANANVPWAHCSDRQAPFAGSVRSGVPPISGLRGKRDPSKNARLMISRAREDAQHLDDLLRAAPSHPAQRALPLSPQLTPTDQPQEPGDLAGNDGICHVLTCAELRKSSSIWCMRHGEIASKNLRWRRTTGWWARRDPERMMNRDSPSLWLGPSAVN